MKVRQSIFSVMVLLAGSILMMGCGAEKDSKVTVNVGYFNNVTHAQALYMKAQGTLEETFGDEVNVAWTAFNAGPAEVEALFAGQIDIGYIGPVPAITANVKSNGDVSILSGASLAGAELVTAPSAGISKVADLDGKKVAIPQLGNTQHLCLLKLLSDNGLKTTDEGGTVTVAAVENADVQNMMDQGHIDAALVPEPWGSTLVAGGTEIVLDYDEVYMDGNYPVAVVVVRKEFMKEHPQIVEEFLKAHLETTSYINDNLNESIHVVNDEINSATGKSLSEDILVSAFSKIVLSEKINEDAIADFEEICMEQKFIDQESVDLLSAYFEENK